MERLVEFTPEELQALNEMAQEARIHGGAWAPLFLKVLDALARYREAERAASEPADDEPVRYGRLR